MKRFRGGLVFKAHRLVYHSTLGLRVITKRKQKICRVLLQVLSLEKGSAMDLFGGAISQFLCLEPFLYDLSAFDCEILRL